MVRKPRPKPPKSNFQIKIEKQQEFLESLYEENEPRETCKMKPLFNVKDCTDKELKSLVESYESVGIKHLNEKGKDRFIELLEEEQKRKPRVGGRI